MTPKNFFTQIFSFTYFPFIGWLFVAFFKKDDDFLIFHSKQAFLMAAYVSIFSSIVFIISGVIDTAVVRFGLVALIYLHYILYLVFCILGTFYLATGKRSSLPFIGRYMEKIEL